MLQLFLRITKPGTQVPETPFLSMDMTSLTPIFVVLSCGMGATLFCLLLEFRTYKTKKENKNIAAEVMSDCRSAAYRSGVDH
jgi:hypothetical protein